MNEKQFLDFYLVFSCSTMFGETLVMLVVMNYGSKLMGKFFKNIVKEKEKIT